MKYNLLFFNLFIIINNFYGQQIESGLVFYAPFDGSTINLVGWEKPDNHGVRFVTDRHGQAYQAAAFNGLNDFLSYAPIPRLSTGNVSLSVWLKAKPIPALHRLNSKSHILANYLELLGLADEAWHHLVIIRHEEDKWEIWIDQQEVVDSSLSPDFENLLGNNRQLSIGAFLVGNSFEEQYYQGALDELRLYNRRLLAEDIRELFQAGSASLSPVIKQAKPSEISLHIYPNPTSRLLQVEFEEAAERRIFIFDEQGRQLRYIKSTTTKETINVAGLPPATYILRVQEKDGGIARKFVKTGAVLP